MSTRPVDHRLLGQFVGAAFDECLSCTEALLVLLVEDCVTTARLVELACISTRELLGGLPDNLTNQHLPSPDDAIEQAVSIGPPVVVVNLAEVSFLGVAGVRALGRAADRCAEAGGQLKVVEPGRASGRVLVLTDTAHLLSR